MNARVEKTDFGWWAIYPEKPIEFDDAWNVLFDIGGGVSTQVVMTTAPIKEKSIGRYMVPPKLGRAVVDAIVERIGLLGPDH